MLKKITLIFILGILISFSITAEESRFYLEKWKSAAEFEKKGLPKSALSISEEIYAKAKDEKNDEEIIKALIHKIKYSSAIEEMSEEKAITALKKEAEAANFPAKALLFSMLGEKYRAYYSRNLWRFAQRTNTDKMVSEDISTWSSQRIIDEAAKCYEHSLSQTEELKKTDISKIELVINKGDDVGLRDTLFDFLAHRALSFYTDSQILISEPSYKFEISNSNYFLTPDKFISLKVKTEDTDSLKYKAFLLYQELIKFHIKDKKIESIIDLDLKRVEFIYRESVDEKKDNSYRIYLEDMLKKYKENNFVEEIGYNLANYYFKLGNKYLAEKTEESRTAYKKAYEICAVYSKGRSRYGTANCKYLMEAITQKKLSVNMEKVIIPNQVSKMLVKYRNIDKIIMRAVKIDADNIEEFSRNYYNQDKIKKYLSQKPEKQWEALLPFNDDYQEHSTEVIIPKLDSGTYLILTGVEEAFSLFNIDKKGLAYNLIDATNISYIKRNSNDNRTDLYILDRTTGLPLENARVQVYARYYDNLKRKYVSEKSGTPILSDKNGFLSVKNLTFKKGEVYINDICYEITYGNERLLTEQIYGYYNTEKEITQERVFLFSDRSIYRPGQTVYFKGLIVKTNGEKGEAVQGKSINVIFYDLNRQEIGRQKMLTNSFGSISGTFVIPGNIITGNFSIETDSPHGELYVSVEEYKRPKFEVVIGKPEKNYRVGETIEVKGSAKAYAGYNIDKAKVKYRVVRNVQYPWFWGRFYWFPKSEPEMEIANGLTTTDDRGEFVITFNAVPNLSQKKEPGKYFSYKITADVTDINGETQSSEVTVNAGYSVLKIETDMPEKIDTTNIKNKKILLNTKDLNDIFTPAKGEMKIFKLKEEGRILRGRLWEKQDRFSMKKDEFVAKFPNDVYDNEDEPYLLERESIVFEEKFDTAEKRDIELSKITGLKTGRYAAEFTAKDRFGESVKDIKIFTIYSSENKELPYKTPNWFDVVKGSGEPGENAEIVIGTSEKNTKILYEIESDGEIEKSEIITLNNEQRKIIIPIEEKHRGNFYVSFVFIKNNRIYKNETLITVPWSSKELKITYEIFRNKLLPGEKEQWKIRVQGKNSEKVVSELLLSMYDASLDAFRPNYWNFNMYKTYNPRMIWETNGSFQISWSYLFADWYIRNYPIYRSYSSLNWFGMDYMYDGYTQRNKRGMFAKGNMLKSESLAESAAPMMAMQQTNDMSAYGTLGGALAEDKKVLNKDNAANENTSEKPKVRTNLNETAFFFPHIIPDKNGDMIVSFIAPESLTRWKIMGFAHTQDMKYGFSNNELVTQKELMVVPNMPRFLRENDEMIFTAKISNMADKDLNGTAKLTLINPETMQPVDGYFENKKPDVEFKVKKGESSAVEWKLKIPSELDTVIVRVTADGGKFTDGEEKMLPILKNRILVTESMPISLRGGENKSFVLEKMLNSKDSATLKNYNYTFEFTSNPVWYAVQALPYLMEYPYECSEQLFNRYYSNAVAAYIANSNPKIEKVFEAWKNDTESKALTSNLDKNQELKSLILQETPWVNDAKDEKERKSRIVFLFEKNRIENEQRETLKKILENQYPSGGWPWFKGMPENWYISQYIVAGLGHMEKLRAVDRTKNDELSAMTVKGVKFIDENIRQRYTELLKRKSDMTLDNLGYLEIQYLYARSFFSDIPMEKESVEPFNYYKSQAVKYWKNKSKYMQGMIALSLYRNGKTDYAKLITASLKEYAINNEELGMYWKEFAGGYYWHNAMIESEALMIEVFDEIDKDTKSVDEMKLWLLKQKQTNDWKTTRATAEACYALLLTGTDMVNETKMPDVKIGDTVIDYVAEEIKVEQGTGYFKINREKSEIKPEMGKITVKNNNNGAAWGAVYWQYFEDLDKITPHETPLKLQKRLFIERNTPKGAVLESINEKNRIKIGDKVKVRIELRVDRDMEFVHMKDMRASALEPENTISSFKFQDGLSYYESTKDAATNFFFDYLPKGNYVFEYTLKATNEGEYSNGTATIQCMYAPEFTSHSEGIRINIDK